MQCVEGRGAEGTRGRAAPAERGEPPSEGAGPGREGEPGPLPAAPAGGAAGPRRSREGARGRGRAGEKAAFHRPKARIPEAAGQKQPGGPREPVAPNDKFKEHQLPRGPGLVVKRVGPGTKQHLIPLDAFLNIKHLLKSCFLNYQHTRLGHAHR